MRQLRGLPFAVKIILITVSVCLTALTFVLAGDHFSNAVVQIIAFSLLFITLYQIFNFNNAKLYTRILTGLCLGILSGLLLKEQILVFVPVGKIFILLIKMIVVPLVLASLFVGTAGMNDLKRLGQIGVKTLVFYLLSTALAITLGLLIANWINPGGDIPVSIQEELTRNYEQDAGHKISEAIERPSTLDLLLNIIPENPARSLADGNMLQIIFFAIIAGFAATYLREDRKAVLLNFFEAVTDIAIRLVHFVMKLAPYGVFALVASVVGQYGTEIIFTLLGYFLTTLLALFLHVTIFNTIVIKLFTGLSIKNFWRGISPALLVAFSTSSSSATLPVSMECAEENLACKPEIASFVLPLGATINMDGTAIFQGVSAVFIAAVYGMDLSMTDQLMIILTATLASIGTAGAPQVGIIMLTMVLQTIGIPLEGIALILGVERFLDMARTMVNVTSDLSCCVFINEEKVKFSGNISYLA